MNVLWEENILEFSFINLCGLLIVVIMLIPNVIYAIKVKDVSYRKVHIAIGVLEQVGRYGSMLLMILPLGMKEFGFASVAEMFVYLFGNVILLVVYLTTWIFYYKKRSLFSAMMLAVVPTLIFLISGITLRHVLLIITAVVFGVAHGYITYQNYK